MVRMRRCATRRTRVEVVDFVVGGDHFVLSGPRFPLAVPSQRSRHSQVRPRWEAPWQPH
jgi:hypothetical protein